MSTIYNPDNTFSFDKLTLAKPILTTGGNYFIRCVINNAPLYIQPPKCKTKQGIISTGKKIYTDMMFSNMNYEFIQWIETLENTCQQHIYNNRENWFDGDMELHEIENYFTSTLKTYKSGKYYLIRSGIPSSLGKPIIKIYDENELQVNINDINDDTDIMNILEIKGIKCSAKSFQIEIELKQILVLKPDNLFDSFLLKGVQTTSNNSSGKTIETVDEPITVETVDEPITVETVDEPITVETVDEPITVETVDEPITVEPVDDPVIVETVDDLVTVETVDEPNLIENENIEKINNQTSEEPIYLEKKNTLEEVQLNLEEITDTIEIKERNDLYYQMYREAKKKGKIARDLALSSFLEAKRIKKTYMLQDISDSEESDLDNEEIEH
jgi:hypothetical protein